jgi:hypothetical protein
MKPPDNNHPKPLENQNNNNNNSGSSNNNSNDNQAKRQAGFLQAEEEGEGERGERREGRLFGEAPGDDALIPRMHRSTVPDDTLMPSGKGTERRFIERLEGIY